jgi:dTDP-4-dehydrorhamnose 3,5-epimerase
MAAGIDGVGLTELAVLPHPDGDVLHCIRSDSQGFYGFGEAYFSTVGQRHIKAWKRHRLMTLNIIVPVGEIRFVIHDDRSGSPSKGVTTAFDLSRRNYSRLTVPPGLWTGFMGLEDGLNMLLNVANIPHDPSEVDRWPVDAITFAWNLA